jgi:hypothetical protein
MFERPCKREATREIDREQAGRSDGQQIMVRYGYAYIGHVCSNGFSVVDVRDPTRPKTLPDRDLTPDQFFSVTVPSSFLFSPQRTRAPILSPRDW